MWLGVDRLSDFSVAAAIAGSFEMRVDKAVFFAGFKDAGFSYLQAQLGDD